MPRLAPADALAQPTRARLFALLGELKRPATTEELAVALGLHQNGVRAHLERLHEANLLTRSRRAQRRGRPRDEWSIAPDARPGGEPPSAYRDVVRWLVKAIPAKPSRLRDIESVGRDVGRDLAPTPVTPAEPALRSALSALGFLPQFESSDGDVLTCTLGNCPYRDAVEENQPVVCALHRGITRGLLDVIAPGAKLTRFEPRDPETAGCILEIHGVPNETEPRPEAA